MTDPGNTGHFTGEMARALERYDIERIRVTEPSVWRVLEYVEGWEAQFKRPVTIMPDTRFIAKKAEFADWAEDRKALTMKYFYREMRRKTGLLMDGDKPVGGKWNFDKENRKPPKSGLDYPRIPDFKPDEITRAVIDMVAAEFPKRSGKLGGFNYAVTQKDAKICLDHIVSQALPKFGDYQDAMVTGKPFLFHSILSPYINAGLLDPLEVCEAAEAAYKRGDVPINSAEGFIRQILGWREYIRGIYWYRMPGYRMENYLNADRKLPGFYWTAKTDMHCMSEAIGQTIEHAHAHHIQRLMVTGNFALLIGADPFDVHKWYLSVYIDAFEWVELPNTIGMSQFGDGGVLGTKPYASSGSYINRMSNYCKNCHYDVKQRTGPDACPFNSLYWHFMYRNRELLEGNHRLAMPYRNLDKMDDETREALIAQAETFLASLSTSRAKDYI